jgi:hypothetical protein
VKYATPDTGTSNQGERITGRRSQNRANYTRDVLRPGWAFDGSKANWKAALIEYRSKYKSHLELWFDMLEPRGHFDVISRFQGSSPSAKGRVTHFYNLHVDLSRDAEAIFRGFARNTRQQIKKSLVCDELRFEYLTDPPVELIKQFAAFYSRFATTKGLSPLCVEPLLAYKRAGLLTLSRALRGDETLLWHATIMYGDRASLIRTASLFRERDEDERKMFGRAHRRLQWADFLHFKQRGVVTYDMGGWYEGNSCHERLMINRFKEEFGGTKVREYCSVEQRSFLAKLSAAKADCCLWLRQAAGFKDTFDEVKPAAHEAELPVAIPGWSARRLYRLIRERWSVQDRFASRGYLRSGDSLIE